MLRTIMVPLDGSRWSEQALPLALTFARRAGARLHLVRVEEPFRELATSPMSGYLQRVAAQLEAALPGRISHSELNVPGPGIVSPPPQVQAISSMLAMHAEAREVDVIVMTTRGRGGLRRAWLGSVADSLLRICSSPVLLIKPRNDDFSAAISADRGVRHVLIPLDGSEAAERVIPVAQAIGDMFQARYTLLRAISSIPYGSSAGWYAAYATVTAMQRSAANAYLDSVATRLSEDERDVATEVVDRHTAEAAVLEFSHSHAVDLIVLSTSGAGGVGRLLLGSVVDKIIHAGDVPVLVCNTRTLPRIDWPEQSAPAPEMFHAPCHVGSCVAVQSIPKRMLPMRLAIGSAHARCPER